MSQLGERLRAAREGLGISLPQAAAETRILQRHLVALEDGDYQHLPGDVYARGFIRNYAEYLHLPSDEMIDLYRRDRGSTDPIRVVPTTSAPRIRKNSYIPSFFGVFFVVLFFVGVSYLVLTLTNNIGEETVAVAVTPTVPPPSPLPTNLPVPSATVAVAVAPTAGQDAAGGVLPTAQPTATAEAATPQATPEAPIVGEVRVANGDHQGSWMRVTVDGTKVFEGVLKPGTSLPIKAQRNVLMRVGSAGVVAVTINGQNFDPLGAPGQPLDWSFPPQ